MNPGTLAILIRHSSGNRGVRAAVGLLEAQGHWMREMAERPDEMAVTTGVEDDIPWADVDWTVLGDRLARHELIGSSGELAALRVACSLAGYPIAIGDLSSLDANNVRLVLTAVAQAAGRPDVLSA